MTRTAFLFPGQGAQHVGMGAALVQQSVGAQRLFDEAREILGFDLAKVCEHGPSAELDSTRVSQPALFVCSLAALESLKSTAPDVVASCELAAGLSLGEYTALVVAGAMSFADGLRVVQVRGQAMQAAADRTPSGMVSALLLDVPIVEQVCQTASAAGGLWIANYLCPGNTVLSGEKAACAAAETAIAAAGGRPIPLAVAGAFHTPLMESACADLAAVLKGIRLTSPKIPVISNVDAQSHADPDELRELLVRQVTQPVRWEDSMRRLLAEGCDRFYEIGPGKVLKGLMKRIDRKADVQTVNDSPP